MSRSVDNTRIDYALGRGAYGAAEALRLINFQRTPARGLRKVARQTIVRWLCGYESGDALWTPDFSPIEGDDVFDVSFCDLIELRFVKPSAMLV